ncbi:MAG: hypothetical protein KGL39_26975, partial [Patescibacteria group bacterium]|nr:hypothetical protein [Patescibacteria group bacterium]
MCFFNDADWYAEVYEEVISKAEKDFACEECGANVSAGEEYRYIFMQENEDTECEFCEKGKERDGTKCLECNGTGSRDPGETFEYARCMECDRFLQAIEAAEIEEGCSRDEARPRLNYLREDIREADPVPMLRRYIKKAIEMFPELKKSGYLGRVA